MSEPNYIKIIREVFRRHHRHGSGEFEFLRSDLNAIARSLGISVPRNLGDNIYAIRHGRVELPDDLKARAPKNKKWLLLPSAPGQYKFYAAARNFVEPIIHAPITLNPDATPQILDRYLLNQEQSLLARIAYCRLIDVFLGVTAYRIQSHLRTTVQHFGSSQIEIDDLYAATEQSGAHFIVPVQAKSVAANERISCVQLICDWHFCLEKFAYAVPRIVAAKLLQEEWVSHVKVITVALFEVSVDRRYNVKPIRERHFKSVPSSMITEKKLKSYRKNYELEQLS